MTLCACGWLPRIADAVGYAVESGHQDGEYRLRMSPTARIQMSYCTLCGGWDKDERAGAPDCRCGTVQRWFKNPALSFVFLEDINEFGIKDLGPRLLFCPVCAGRVTHTKLESDSSRITSKLLPKKHRAWVWGLVAAAALLGCGAAWWMWFRPSPLERARKDLDRADPAAAVEVLLKRLDKGPRDAAEALDLKRELARAYLMKGAYDNAEAALRALLQASPDDFYGNLALGFLFFSKGQDAFAAESFQKAKSLEPGDLRASHALVALYNFRGEHDKARAEALDLLNRAPTDAQARMGLGRADLGRGLFADAAASFETAMAASAANEAASQLLIQALLGAGEYRRAEEALAPLLKQAPEDPSALFLQADYFLARSMGDQAEAIYRRIYEKDARRLFAGVALAKLLARRRETEAAQTLLMDIAQRLPKPDDIPPPSTSGFYEPWETLETRDAVRRLRVDFHRAMAEVYVARYLLPDAEREIQLALQILPRNLPARRAWTEMKRLGGDVSERVAAARSSAEVFPEHPEVLMDLAQALAAAGRPPEALTYAQAAAAACPALSRAQAVLAETRLAAGNKADAARAASKAEELNDRDPEAYLADGLVKAARGDWREAEVSFGKAVELDPFLAWAHWERARTLDKLNKKRPARAHRDKALELEPRVFAGKM